MPSLSGRSGRPTSAEHQAAVSRRLDLLRAELAGPGQAAEHPGQAWAPTADGAAPWWSSATRVPGPRLRVVASEAPEAPEAPRPGPEPPPVHIFGPPPWVPVPGRHASRRVVDLTGWMPQTLRGRVALGPSQLTVVAVLVAIGLAVTAWSVLRARPEPAGPPPTSSATLAPADSTAPLVQLPVPPGTTPASGATGALAAPAAGAASVPTTVTVDVAGKVRRPGIAVLDPGARVVDALAAAGGARAGVDLTGLNLARPLLDGEQILVGVPPAPGVAASALASDPAGSTAGSAGPAGSGALVNLNTAVAAELDTLPEVGPVTAQSIIAWRMENGGFTSVDELLEVDGIGEATLSRIAPYVTL